MIGGTYEHKALNVKATYWIEQGDHHLVFKMPALKRAWLSFWYGQRHVNRVGLIKTREGVKTVRSGDWIVEFTTGDVDTVDDIRFRRDYRFVHSSNSALQEW